MKPTVPEVLPIVRALFRRNSAGCCWHTVLDDGNVSRSSVQWCAKHAVDTGCRAPECYRLAELLPQMSPTQVGKLSRLAHGDSLADVAG